MFYMQKHMRLLLCRRYKQFTMNYFHQSFVEVHTDFLKVIDQNTGNAREIAYKKYEGSKENQIIYIPGFMSGMSGTKASALDMFCQKNGFTYTRYDPTGLGESLPLSLRQARLTHWIQDAESVLNMDREPKIVVASSMGGWVAISLCLRYPEKFHALVLLAPGINFTKRYFNHLSSILPKPLIEQFKKGETITFEHPEYGNLQISLELSEDFYKNELDFSQGINIKCPVRIIHGTLDVDVPYEESMILMHRLKSSDVQLTYIKDAQHRLSTNDNLELIYDVILKLISKN